MKKNRVYQTLIAIFFIAFYFLILYFNSPQYKYLQKIKQPENKNKINVFFSYTMVRQTGGGIPFVAYDMYSNLQKREDINIYSQGSEMVYRRKHIVYFAICKLLKYREVNNDIIKNTDIFFSIHPDDITVKTFKNSNFTKKNIKYYTIIHDVHMAVQYDKELKDISRHKTEEERISLLRAEKADSVYRFFDLDKMDGIFVISKTSLKDTELFFPEAKNIPKHLIYWPITTRKVNTDLYFNTKKIFGNEKLAKKQLEEIKDFIKNNKLYIMTSISKNFVPVYEAVKKINQKHPNLNLKIAFISHRGGMPAMYGMKSYIELDKNFNPDENCFQTGLVSTEGMQTLMKNASIYISNNFYEGYGLDSTDAMQNGIPLIVNDAGANREIVANGGYIIKNKEGCKLLKYFSQPFTAKDICEIDENDLMYAIEKVIFDKEFTKKMIQNGKKQMQERDLSWNKLTNLLVAVWKKDLKLNV